MTTMQYLDATRMRQLIGIRGGVDALHRALNDDAVNPENDGPRLFEQAPEGEFLLMPSMATDFCGVKTLTLAPDNPARGKPRVQGVYTLFRNEDLAPVMMMDATELTLVRTPATTMLAAKHLIRAKNMTGKIRTAVIFGTGPQSEKHARGIAELIRPEKIVIVGRRDDAAEQIVRHLRSEGIAVQQGTSLAVAEADLVVTVTASKESIVDDQLVRDDAIVLSVGTHGLEAREVPPALARRADVVVEGRTSAMREGGNIIPARSVQEWQEMDLPNIQDLAKGHFALTAGRPVLFSGVGMAWEDLVIASEIYHRHQSEESE
ncbi:ornithine cyclodeaminase family protein [Rothia sp. AR01]|uniref:Ornithine cyclodeaminase family protein n=1 Tax=Rothia santali TaxID=2949643 RepID=A0A9X2H9M7_9MICC|nr:ornithine cyclodeaminase family protein [Rothia santali]MCP3425211.1 ornithine cyclodeaminase family protein [Rothia santali]